MAERIAAAEAGNKYDLVAYLYYSLVVFLGPAVLIHSARN
jgi:hypothetical protein